MSFRETSEIEDIVISWEKFSGGDGHALLTMFDFHMFGPESILNLFNEPAFVEVFQRIMREREALPRDTWDD